MSSEIQESIKQYTQLFNYTNYPYSLNLHSLRQRNIALPASRLTLSIVGFLSDISSTFYKHLPKKIGLTQSIPMLDYLPNSIERSLAANTASSTSF